MKEDNSTAGAVSAGTGSDVAQQRTPGPWHADDANGEGCFGIFAVNGEPLAMLCETKRRRGSVSLMDDIPLPLDPLWRPYEFDSPARYARLAEHNANAAFIVRACNAHDELVARLEATLHTLGLMADAFPLGSATRNTLEEECAAIRAATAKATAPVDAVEEQGLAVTSEGTP